MEIKFTPRVMRQIRTSDAVVGDIQRRAQAIADACGEGFAATPSVPRNRARSAVIAVTHKARRTNAKHNTIMRNLDKGRQ